MYIIIILSAPNAIAIDIGVLPNARNVSKSASPPAEALPACMYINNS